MAGAMMKKRTKRTLAVSGKVFLRLLLCTVLCAIMYFSMLTIATALFSDVIGFQVYDTQSQKGENFYFVDGVTADDKPETTENQIVTDLRAVSDKTLVVFQIVSQIMMLIVLAIFPYHILWGFGNRDDTNVRYKGQRPDPLRGYKIGMLASIPYAVLWVLLLLTKYGVMPTSFTEVFRWATIPFMPFVNWLTMNGNIVQTSVWQIVALLPVVAFVPAVCGISYQLGHRQFSIREHLVFAKKAEETEEEI